MKTENSPRNRFFARKLIVLATSLIVGINMGFASYFYFSKDMTDWQRNQPMDLRSESGLTKAKAYADSFSVGGVSFCLCAGIMLLVQKLKKNLK